MLKYSLIALGMIVLAPMVHAEIAVGAQAPCVTLTQLDPSGKEVPQSTCKAEATAKKVVLEFFATDCGYCIQNLPVFESLAKKLSDKAEFRIVGYDSDPQLLRNYFAARDHSQYSITFDPKMQTLAPFDVTGTPDIFVIGTDGKITLGHLGTMDDSDAAAVAAAINQ